MNLSGKRLPMREKQVNQYLDNIELFGKGVYQSSSFDNRIVELQKLKSKLLEQEQRVYKELGVSSIDELNAKVSSLKGLQGLSGAKLAAELNSLIIDDKASSGVQLILDLLQTREWEEATARILQDQDYQDIFLQDIIKEFTKTLQDTKNIKYNLPKTLKSNKTFGIRRLLEGVSQESGKWIIQQAESKKVSKHMKTKLKETINITTKSENAAESTISIVDTNRMAYAGWRYSWNEVKGNIELINKIRTSILSLCLRLIKQNGGSSLELSYFEQAFNKYPTQALLQSTIAGVQGAIGEIQLGAIVNYLTNGKNSNTLQTGAMRNALANNQQISVDFLLSNFGFQVKNYNEYAYSIPRSIQIKHTKKLSTWCDELELNNVLTEMLNTFYAIRWFNEKFHSDYQDTKDRITAIEESLNNFYAQYPDRILRLSEDVQVLNAGGDSVLAGRFYNTFYFVSGQKFIPSSRLIQNIIDFFHNIEGATNEVQSQSSYSGANFSDFTETGAYSDAPPFSKVYSNVDLTLSYRIYLDQLLKV